MLLGHIGNCLRNKRLPVGGLQISVRLRFTVSALDQLLTDGLCRHLCIEGVGLRGDIGQINAAGLRFHIAQIQLVGLLVLGGDVGQSGVQITGTRCQIAHAGMQVAHLAVQGLGGVVQLLGAVMQLPGAVVQITDGGDQLVYLVHQIRVVHVDVQIQPHAVDGGRVHLEVRHIGGDNCVDPLTGQNGVGQLLVAAHIGNGSAVADNVLAALGVQRERGLQSVVVIEAAAAALVFRNGEPDLQRTALSRHVLRGVFLSVQIVPDGDIPRQRGVLHRPLIVDLIGSGGKDDLIPILGDRVVGV